MGELLVIVDSYWNMDHKLEFLLLLLILEDSRSTDVGLSLRDARLKNIHLSFVVKKAYHSIGNFSTNSTVQVHVPVQDFKSCFHTTIAWVFR